MKEKPILKGIFYIVNIVGGGGGIRVEHSGGGHDSWVSYLVNTESLTAGLFYII